MIFVLALTFGFTADVEEASAQSCDVTSAQFRTNREVNSIFYDDENTPYVYIDIVTANCSGETIQVSITEDDAGVDDDVNGTLGMGQTCNETNPSCMDNRVISITGNETTLSLRAGEDECQSAGNPDCDYHIETWDEVDSGYEWESGLQLNYNCDGACQNNWQYLGTLTPFGASDQGDQDDDGDAGVDEGADASVDENSIGIQATNYDLSLNNPLAGTIDSIPQLLQKIVNVIIKVSIPIVAMAIVFSGFLFVTARGSDEQLKKAKQVLLYAVIGGLILMASWLIAEAIYSALTSFD